MDNINICILLIFLTKKKKLILYCPHSLLPLLISRRQIPEYPQIVEKSRIFPFAFYPFEHIQPNKQRDNTRQQRSAGSCWSAVPSVIGSIYDINLRLSGDHRFCELFTELGFV